MADLNTCTVKKERGLTRKPVKKSTRTDLTPMVDLGFLLITFFIFTTTLTTAKSLKLRMPKDDGTPMPVDKERGLVIVADSTGHYYSFETRDPAGSFRIHTHNNPASLRQVIQDKKAALRLLRSEDPYPVTSIKFMPGSHYQALTSLLDKVRINNMKWYVITNITTEDQAFIARQTAMQPQQL